MPSGFLQTYIDEALRMHSEGWRSWAQGEPLHAASEWLAQHIPKFPQAAKSVATLLNNKMWNSGETMDRWVGRSVGSQNLLQDIQRLDESVLRALNKNGFLTHTPKVVYVWSDTQEQTAGQNIPHSDGWGEIKMFLKTSGRLVSTSASPDSISHQMNKWLVLFHEASHNEFYTSLDIFTPDAGFTPQEIQLINDWGMNRLFCSRASLMLSEAFADCYGSMMLLEGFGHSLESCTAVENLIALRAADDTSLNPTKMYELCSTALRDMWKHRTEWKGKSPEAIKRYARMYSSNAVLSVGLMQGTEDGILNGLVEDKMRIQPFMFEFCLEYIQHTSDSFLDQMDRIYAQTPMWPHVKHICQQLQQTFDDSQNLNKPHPLLTTLIDHKDVDSHIVFKRIQQPLSQYLREALVDLSATPQFSQDWGQYALVRECIFQRSEQLQVLAQSHIADQLKSRRPTAASSPSKLRAP